MVGKVLAGSVLFSLGCACSSADVLIYSDQSPGALPYMVGYQQAAQQAGEDVDLETEVSSFASKLSSQSWADVIVVARYAPGDPPYTAQLRDYANADLKRSVEMLFWNDNGTKPTADTAVAATTLYALWNHGSTSIAYMNQASGSGGAMVEGDIRPGYEFPSFDGVRVQNPEVLVRAPEKQRGLPHGQLVEEVVTLLSQPKCREKCLANYATRLGRCITQFCSDQNQCYALYGPEGAKPDAKDLTKCVKDLDSGHATCVASAGNADKNCLKLCPPEQ